MIDKLGRKVLLRDVEIKHRNIEGVDEYCICHSGHFGSPFSGKWFETFDEARMHAIDVLSSYRNIINEELLKLAQMEEKP